ncbi:MAG: prephenate dehydrogenase/arogenate dehydrogenase family protein [Nanoarchaeota archaeon]
MAKLAVIGAGGTMGSYVAKYLYRKTDRIYAFDIDKVKLVNALNGIGYELSSDIASAVRGADYVIFCVPTDKVKEAMFEALPHCKNDAIISGQTSRKTPEAEAFDAFKARSPNSKIELVTLHTMCDPSKTNPEKEILGIIGHNASNATFKKVIDFYGHLSSSLHYFSSVDEHDMMVAHTQINVSRTNLAIASAFAHAGCFPWISGNYGTGFDSFKFSLAMRTASQPGHVYRGIQFGSPHGKDIVRKAIEAEHKLFGLIVADKKREYKEVLRRARDFVFKGRKVPILTEADIEILGSNKHSLPNSDLSLMQFLLSYAEIGRNPFDDLKATTPMHRSLLCLLDRLCMTSKFEESLEAPFQFPNLRADDLVFDRELTTWSNAILYDNSELYNDKHSAMTAKLPIERVKLEIEKSKIVVSLCRQRLEEKIAEEEIITR